MPTVTDNASARYAEKMKATKPGSSPSKKWLKPINLPDFLRHFIQWTLWLFLATHAHADSTDTPPIEAPFNPKYTGEVYSFQANILEQMAYSVDICLYIKAPSKWPHFFDEKPTPEEAKRFYAIFGGGRKTESGRWSTPEVPAIFRIQLIRDKTKEVILDERVNRPEAIPSAYGRYATLAVKTLPAGLYTIRIEYIYGAPELAPLYAKIQLTRAHHGK